MFARRCDTVPAAATTRETSYYSRDYTRQASDEAALTASNLGLALAAAELGNTDVDPAG
jgi:hypothetical protein